ncbi:hypothetical protein E3N88_09489 [Mikania micrantha]|uniref:CCHC-type domain-containing protein n=1 Tax=Mikania micrantha TaxID=192012 RepID=A0A5N6PLH3_9ASTR|nr:hypothetical protein E3N88_09489 [Mikania micrantha]
MAEGEGSKSDDQINTNSPLYLHPSDYPRQMQVNDVLTDRNFSDWKQEMTNFLFAKNKIGFVNGKIKKPREDERDFMAWMRCDTMVKGWLTTAMEKEIRASVKYGNTAREIWKDLNERFGKESAPRAYELKQTLNTTRQEGTSVSAYYTKLRGIWDEINTVLPTPRCDCDGCKCGVGKKLVELKEKERLYEFLLRLDSDFSVIRTQILAIRPTPTLSNAYHMVAEDEQQRNLAIEKKNPTEAAAFYAGKTGRKENTPQKKSWQKGERSTDANKVDRCTHCGKEGHVREGCFKRIGYPDWWQGKGKKEGVKPKAAFVDTVSSPVPGLTDEQYGQFLKLVSGDKEATSHIANMAGTLNVDGNWAMDSGATEHMTYDKELLENFTIDVNEPPVTVANGANPPVKGTGEVSLMESIKIKGVLFVPNFKCNLLSVRRLTKDLHCAVTFFPDFFVIQELKTRSLIGAGNCINGLYRMGAAKEKRKAMAAASGIWHKRLGHSSSDKLSSLDVLKNLNFSYSKKDCDSCIRAKLTKLPFQISSIKTSDCFDMLKKKSAQFSGTFTPLLPSMELPAHEGDSTVEPTLSTAVQEPSSKPTKKRAKRTSRGTVLPKVKTTHIASPLVLEPVAALLQPESPQSMSPYIPENIQRETPIIEFVSTEATPLV